MRTAIFRAELSAPGVVTSSRTGFSVTLQLAFFCAAILLIVSRRTDALYNPQFFAEDGKVWFADAYNLGWLKSLLLPYAGYFTTIQRVAAALALTVPLRFAPLIMNGIGMVIQVLPVNFLLSSRCSKWGSLSFRSILALTYLTLPNTQEVHITVTNAQWHMALIAALIIIALPARTWAWRIFDLLILLLCGLTGPFCILLVPIVGTVFWKFRDRWRSILLAVLTACSLLQITTIVCFASAVRSTIPLGATPEGFLKLLGGHVFLGALLGENVIARTGSPFVLVPVALAGIAIFVYCFTNATLEWKALFLFIGMVLGCSLASPFVTGVSGPAWFVLEITAGNRYWFFPTLAFAWSLLWCVHYGKSEFVRAASIILLIFMSVGIVRDYRLDAYRDLGFRQAAARFDAAPVNSVFTIPLNPRGWSLRLVKR